MANKTLFKSTVGRWLPAAPATNEAGGSAYRFSPEHELAQYVVTGCLNGTFYADAETQLARIQALALQVDARFLAQLAVYARKEAYMKDTPALLLAMLTKRDLGLFKQVAPRVIDNTKMLRDFVQIMRSGAVGRKSLGTAPKRFVQDWLNARPAEDLFRGNIGQNPSLADVLKMVHPTPPDVARAAFYAYVIGKPHNEAELPALVREFEAFKSVLSQSDARAATKAKVPEVPFQMLTALPLTEAHWKAIAENAPWQMTRMNLNTFARHGVFSDKGVTKRIAARLADSSLIRKARVFPYQLLAAYRNTTEDIPNIVRNALQDALEVATANVPEFVGQVVVCPDASGSMHSSITGNRPGATSTVRCVDVAALVAAVVLRRNEDARVLPFTESVVKLKLNPRDSVMTNAKKLSEVPAGGTNCSAPLAYLNAEGAKADLMIFVSDNESWIDTKASWKHERATETMRQWEVFKQRNPHAKLVCIDLQPYGTTQAIERDDILNIGGFSDQVFSVIRAFAAGELRAGHWVEQIKQAVPLEG